MSTQSSKTKKGLKWSVIDQVVRQFITLVISGILSRLLTPAEYGLLGMVTVAIGFLQVFKDIGLGSSIIQKQGITAEEQSTIFWLSIMIGLVLALMLVLTAPLIADFFNEPQLTLLIRVMSLNFLFSSMAIVPDALIQKAIDFKSYFYRNLGTTLLGGLLGIGLAFKGFGVWALVGQSLLTSFAGLIISFRMVQWRPQWIFNKTLLKSHLRFSLPLLGDSSINYWVRNIDNLLVGKFLGAVSLGIYNRAYGLMLLPLRQISSTISRVMFPSFALIQHDAALIWDQYCKMMSLVAMATFPLMAFLGVYAHEVILIVYGPGWMEVVPLLKILSFLGAVQSIATLAGPVYYAKGKTLLLFRVGLVSKTLMIAGIILGLVYGGLTGMVWCYLLSSMIAFFVEVYFVCYMLFKKITDFFTNVAPEFIASLLYLGILLIAKYWYGNTGNFLSPSFIGFHFVVGLLALLAYIYILHIMRSKGLQIAKKNIYGKRKEVPSFNDGRKVH
ncbi:MOP flippase family protein [Agriterribacter humi]|uniref:MOP flippase family protein n=1 Tax=Agriterribacter humi TaxID=1104781 RepID=UPI0012645DDC|nr:MOP flippase family protein [Agriterribacter humi]